MHMTLRTSSTLKVRLITLSHTQFRNPGKILGPYESQTSPVSLAKKVTKQAPIASEESRVLEFEVSTDSSGGLYEETTIGKAITKGKGTEKAKGKKVVAQESESPLKGSRKKNHIVCSPHTPYPNNNDDDDEEVESSMAKGSSDKAQGSEERCGQPFGLINEIADILAGLFPRDGQTDIAVVEEATEVEAQTEGLPTDITSTFSTPPPVQSVPPRPRELYERPVVVKPVVEIVIPTVHVPNSWTVPEDTPVEETKELRQDKKRTRKEYKATKKNPRAKSIQNEQDRQTRVHEMALGAGELRALIMDTEGVDVMTQILLIYSRLMGW
ncbi:hypothetical protein FXO38_04651 [Capsicum annuum]|nr:hypothetical protein FXO38_04651 [Capsicum annuum]